MQSMNSMDSPNNKIFSRSRIANILSAITILWTLGLWSYILFQELDGQPIMLSEANGTLLLTVMSLISGMCGFALKHIYDECGR